MYAYEYIFKHWNKEKREGKLRGYVLPFRVATFSFLALTAFRNITVITSFNFFFCFGGDAVWGVT